MNSYSLASESRRWWWPPAAVGVGVAGAVAAIVVLLPVGVQASPTETTRQDAPVVFSGPDSQTGHPCYMTRPQWHAIDGYAPVCH